MTAPHATQPTRDGKLRAYSDGGTGPLALMLHRLADATVLYTAYASPSDPNYYDDNAFKQTLDSLIVALEPTVVLDLHSSHAYRPYDIDFGTMHGRSLLDRNDILPLLHQKLSDEGLRNFSSNYFAAAKNQTVTKWVTARGVPCIQVEINYTWLNPDEDGLHAHRFAQVLQGLVRFIRAVDRDGS